jgi:hypothetical protein
VVVVENDDQKIARSFLAPKGASYDLVFSANYQRWLAENCKNGAGVFRRPTHFVCLLVIVENDDQKIEILFIF